MRSSVGTAPGIRIALGGCTVFALPGVVREMQWHFENHVAPALAEQVEHPRVSRTLKFAGIGESTLAQRIGELSSLPDTDILYRTHLPENHVRLRAASESALDTLAQMIIETAPDAYLGDGAISLASATLETCRAYRSGH